MISSFRINHHGGGMEFTFCTRPRIFEHLVGPGRELATAIAINSVPHSVNTG